MAEATEQNPKWFIDTLDYLGRLNSLGAVGIQDISDEVSAELRDHKSTTGGMEAFDAASGAFIRHVAELERSVAVFLGAFLVPDDPVPYISNFLELSAFQRSDGLRKVLGGRPHWKRLIDEVQDLAVLRNKVAHGGRSLFDFAPDGQSMRWGWFIRYFRKSSGKWIADVEDVSGDRLTVAGRRAATLAYTVDSAVRVMVTRRMMLQEDPGIPNDLREVVAVQPAAFRQPDWLYEIADELFGPLATNEV